MWRTFALLTIYLFFRCSLYFWKSHNPFSHTQISIIFLIKNSKHWNKKLTMITFTFLITSILNKTKNSVIILLREETVIWLEIQESFFRNPCQYGHLLITANGSFHVRREHVLFVCVFFHSLILLHKRSYGISLVFNI